MNMPGFTAETSLFKTLQHYNSRAWSQGALGGGPLSSIQIAILDDEGGPSSKICTGCSSNGWRDCWDNIGTTYPKKGEYLGKEACASCSNCMPSLAAGGKFMQICVVGGKSLPPKPCEVCKTISTPWYVPDDLRICCKGPNFLTDCSFQWV
jgi:hypothetical protein